MRWDPVRYLQFADERGRPFADLMSRVAATDPALVVDLGCGPGTLTVQLADRWPGARVHGVDSSPEMVERARGLVAGVERAPRVTFAVGDLRDWGTDRLDGAPAGVDVLVSHATLQWVPDHLDLLGRLVGLVRPGGWLALQVPANFDAPSHTALAGLAASDRWREHLGGADVVRAGAAAPEDYLARLAGLGCVVDAWETTYLHVLVGQDPVVQWMRGTGLRPYLEALPDDAAREAFVDAYRDEVAAAYPRREWGTVLPFRRIFVVAQRRDG